ncbi:MAG: class I SAM-dependent methyltransferase [Bdellovibrionota bacterium]
MSTTETVAGRDYYDTNYPNYQRQNPAHKLNFLLGLVKKSVPEGSLIFELGVGLGAFLERASQTYRCEGSDINAYGLSITRRSVPGAVLHTGSYEVIPEPTSGLEAPLAVVAWDVLEHLPDLESALRVIQSRLHAGGFLIAVVPVYDGPLGWLVRRFDKDPTHVSKLSRQQWLTHLRSAGFEVVEFGGLLRKLIGGRYYVHWTRPQFLLRSVGSAIYFTAKKPDATTSPAAGAPGA